MKSLCSRTLRAAAGLTLVSSLLIAPAAGAFEVEVAATNLDEIVSIAFDPDGRIFFTQKQGGKIGLVVDGVVRPDPVIDVDVLNQAVTGMIGVAVDPDFENNHFFYVHYTVGVDGSVGCVETEQVVVRYREENEVGVEPLEIFSSPMLGDCSHNTNNIRFGPDGKLYISIGEDRNKANAQDLSAKNGKIHRINSDGTIPPDNPFVGVAGAEPSVWASGLRNSFDFDFDPVTGAIFASENGPFCDDEMNLILPGNNYGWRGTPLQLCNDTNAAFNTIPPMWIWNPTIAPVGVAVYDGGLFPMLENGLLVCASNTGNMHHLILDETRTTVVEDVIMDLDGRFCHSDVEVGPDGFLYFVEGGAFFPGTLLRVVP